MTESEKIQNQAEQDLELADGVDWAVVTSYSPKSHTVDINFESLQYQLQISIEDDTVSVGLTKPDADYFDTESMEISKEHPNDAINISYATLTFLHNFKLELKDRQAL